MGYGGGNKKKKSGMKRKVKKTPKGFHRMPNGKIMKGSSHKAYLKNKKKKY